MTLQERAKILRKLVAIDMKSIRPLRARLFNTATQQDENTLTALENEARALREELNKTS